MPDVDKPQKSQEDQDTKEGSKQDFDDLPDEKKGDEQPEDTDAATDTNDSAAASESMEVLKKQLEDERKEKQRLSDALEKQNAARSEARKETKKVKEELVALKKKSEQLSSSENKDDEKTDSGDSSEQVDDIKQVVNDALSERLYQRELIKGIKERAVYRSEALEIQRIVTGLLEGGLSTGDPQMDIEQAYSIYDGPTRESNVMPSPSSVGGGYTKVNDRNAKRKSAIEFGKNFGHNEEDFKKYDPDEEIKL